MTSIIPVLHRFAVALAALALVALAPAQPIAPPAGGGAAPAGNDHPETRLVDTGATVASPFGDPSQAPSLDARGKAAFAAQLDLTPLQSLAVFHNGRVKIIDTLAGETLRYMAGRDRLDLPAPAEGGGVDKVTFDPIFTLLDIMIDPAFYATQPILHVDYLPLREAYLAEAFPGDAEAQLRWKKLTRVSPVMVLNIEQSIFDAHGGEEPYRVGMTRVRNRLDIFRFAPSNLLLVAPASRAEPWRHLGELPADAPERAAAARLGAAWRAGDAATVNEAVAELSRLLPAINPDVYPTTRRSIEAAYNRLNAFELGYWVYLLSLLALILAFGTQRRWLSVTGNTLLVAAVALHAAGFIARCVIAERFAIQNQFESMTGLSLFAAVVGLVLMMLRRQPIFGAAAAACGFLALIGATQTGIPGVFIEKEAPILNTSVLLKYHVTTVLTSYGLITLGFIVSCFYLVTHYAARAGASASAQFVTSGALAAAGPSGSIAATPPTLARTLADLDHAQLIMLQLAFWTLGVGILLGAWWADHSWGRWWAFDPKETWALITWIIYLIAIHTRFAGLRDKGLTTAWLSVVGFVVMLFTYFGVNLLLPGLHAYA